MATTSNTYTGNGTNKLFSITYPYLDTSDINVYLNGTLQTITTQYTFANATTVEFVTAPANGAVILLDRSTDDNTLQATFFPGSSIKANDLNFNFDQVLYLAQETANSAANQSTAGLQTQITTATNTANAAVVTANTANSTANTANTTANGIAGTANTALTNANAAVVTANAIAGTANTALANSSAAVATANTALPLAGGTMTGVITYATAQPRLVLDTAKSSTSGTSVDFTGIPSWVKRVTVMLNGVSTSGTSLLLLRVGSGSFTSAGYGSQAWTGSSGTTVATVGLVVTGATNAANIHTGVATLQLVSSNQWVFSSALTFTNATSPGWTSAGFTPALGGALDRIRLTTDNGTDTFDAGTVNIIYEG